jgi:gamma-glutamyl phosphate reductase
MKEQEVKLLAEMDSMSPVMEKAEELTKKEYERQRHEGLKNNVIDSLEAKETPYEWFTNIWNKVKHEVKDPIFKELSAQEQSKLLKIKKSLKNIL